MKQLIQRIKQFFCHHRHVTIIEEIKPSRLRLNALPLVAIGQLEHGFREEWTKVKYRCDKCGKTGIGWSVELVYIGKPSK